MHTIEHDTGMLPQCAGAPGGFDSRNRSKAGLLARLDQKRCNAVLAAMVAAGTAYVPTHIASIGQDWLLLSGAYADDERVKYVAAPQRWLWRFYAGMAVAGTDDEHRPVLEAYYRASQRLTQRAHAQGVAVMAGSDAMDPYVTHGFGLHDELAQLAQAGLTPAEALRAATWTPARHFGRERDFGSVEAGKIADLVLLDRNPLEDIQHARAIHAVVFNGNVHSRKDLDAMLAYTAAQASSFSVVSKFVWAMLKP
jgi:cytosine/adenosine deaminase-related metal-dependent hydrolase